MAGKNRGKNNRTSRFDRNKAVGPMTEFQRMQNPEGAEELGIVATFENNRYGVFLKTMLSPGFAMPGPDGRPQPMEIMQLVIVRHDKKKTEIPWEEKQFIKNSILGENTEGMELFPSEQRRMRTIVDHQTHLWVLPPGSMIPAGLIPKAMQALAQRNALAKFTVTKDELELYMVEDGEVLQIFASEEEAKESYEKAENEMPEGKTDRIDNVPTEDTGVIWSEGAKLKVGSVLEKSATLDNLTDSKDRPTAIEESQARVNTNGPVTDQDGLEEEYGVGDFAPNSDEENVMMPEYMELGVEQMKVNRALAITDAVANLNNWMEKSKVDKEQEAKDEAEAKDELEAMREEARKKRSEED